MPYTETKRLHLRPLRLPDAEAFHTMTDEPAIVDAISFLERPFGLADAERLIAGDDGGRDCFWGVWKREGLTLLGTVGTHLKGTDEIEVGYWFASASQGLGLASEAVTGVMLVLLVNYPERRIIAECRPENEASWRLLERVGFRADELPRSMGSGSAGSGGAGAGACRILSVGVLTPRKGHDVLLRALARLGDLGWTLDIAGADGRDPGHAEHLAALAADPALDGRVRLVRNPEPAALEALWRDADLFALATRWEGYPAAVAEAMRRGLPLLVSAGGSAADLVPPDAGLACALDDEPTLSKCLRRLVFDRGLRADMAEASWAAGQRLPGWPEQAALLDQVLGG